MIWFPIFAKDSCFYTNINLGEKHQFYKQIVKKQLLSTLLSVFFSSAIFAQENPIPTPQWRPVYHFTPEKNWTNDPNGLIYIDGVYHLYNQQNPYENKWGHMSWGHATSKDLIHWNHLPVAMPEKINNKDTTWIFSGCAVWDKNNTSGFCKKDGCIAAIYTADQPNLKKESQFMAYSNDGGLTYTNYEKNPVIDRNKKDFRDPNVIWLKDQNKWLMTVALPAEHKVRFYSSANLKDWALLSEFGGQGDTRKIWECPSLTPLPVDGNPAKTKWLLMISSGNQNAETGMQYFIGDFDGKSFTNNYSPDNKMFVDYGSTYYAAIPWNNLPNNKHTMIGWLVPTKTATYPWRGQMSIPRDLILKTTPDGIRLFQQPGAVISNVLSKLPVGKTMIKKNLEVKNQEIALNTQTAFNANTNWIEAEFTLASAIDFGFKVAQQKDVKGNVAGEIVIGYNTKRNELYISHNVNGSESEPLQKLTIKPRNNKLKLQVLLDKSSLEVFANDGEKVITTLIFPEKDATQFSLFAKDGNLKADVVKIWDLDDIDS